ELAARAPATPLPAWSGWQTGTTTSTAATIAPSEAAVAPSETTVPPSEATGTGRHAATLAQRSPPPAASVPPQGLTREWLVGITGLVIAGAGGWLYHHAGTGAASCTHRAAVVCSQGYVLLNTTQLASI